ncbi:MAG: ParA family protein [Sediminispirochaetaceae bacterium]
MAAKTIVFANQKGGVGKTTSAVNIGAYLAESGKKVLLIDFDPQGNLSSSVGAERERSGIYELITEQVSADGIIQSTSVSNLSVIPADINLTGANIELIEAEEREFFLKKSIQNLSNGWDYILIDSPPSLGLLTLNGLVGSDQVFIPLQCEYFAMEGLSQLLKTIRMVQKALNPQLKIGGIFFTMYDSRTNLANEVVQEVTGYFKQVVFKTIIPRNVKLSEAPSHKVPINQYNSSCIGAISYQKLAQEVIERV